MGSRRTTGQLQARPKTSAFSRVFRSPVAALSVGAAELLLALALITLTWADRPYPLYVWVPVQAAGLSLIICGAWLWRRRPDNATGALMSLAGASWYLGDLQLSSHPLAFALGFCLFYTDATIVAHMLMALPDGRLHHPSARVVAALMYVGAPVTQTLRYFDEDVKQPQIWGEPELSTSVWADVGSFSAMALTVLAIGIVARRWREAGRPLRRQYALLWATLLTAGCFALTMAAVCVLDVPEPARSRLLIVLATGFFLAPAALAAGLVLTRLGRLRIADLVEELDRAESPGEVRRALAKALDDPTLEVLYWLPDQGRYVNGQGLPRQVGDGTGRGAQPPDRATTLVEARRGPLAMLVHDAALAQQQVIVAPVVATARLALENAQLEAAARAQLAEIRDSRARLVAAADSERRRIQRDLHDGAQHKLLAVSMLLARATDAPAGTHLSNARTQLREVVGDLRAITEGIHPPALTEQGLAAALEVVAERAPLPVEVSVPNRRWPELVERTAYFVVTEALSNTYRHSGATSALVRVRAAEGMVRVEVQDDGCGLAVPRVGGGLQGLEDRAQAAGGRLLLMSRPGAGTLVRLELPCAS